MQPDRFMRMCGTDEPITDCLVIDAHCHVDQWMGMFAIERHLDGLLELCDAVGIDKICVNYAAAPDMRPANDHVAECVRRYPDRVVGICYVNYFGGPDIQRDELTRCFDELGFRGAKVGNFNELYPQGPGYFELDDPLQPTWEFAQERGTSILCHGIVSYDIAARYPGANFIVAHGSSAPALCVKLAELPNTYCDMSATSMVAGTLELLCEKMGPDRILYGSDMPASDAGQRLGMVMAAHIPETSKELILGGNMARLLGLSDA